MGGSRNCVWKGYVPDCLLDCVNSLAGWSMKVCQQSACGLIRLDSR